MISPAYLQTMATYNSEMNRRVYASAARLPDTVRRESAGAFWGSIQATLSHLVWADQMWMSRFDGWDKPTRPLRESNLHIDDFDTMHATRIDIDARIEAWTKTLGQTWIDGQLSWYSGAAKRDVSANRAKLLVHMFNHQTHHRGQVHALLTRAGEDTGDTDLWLLTK
jgi:uncharacterized damage-inducible protein DinB